ncbi:hypothetical protein NKH99_15340 [Mesorhizobium sp. M0854]
MTLKQSQKLYLRSYGSFLRWWGPPAKSRSGGRISHSQLLSEQENGN